MRVPPVHYAAAVRVPTPYRAKALQEMPAGWFITLAAFTAKSLTKNLAGTVLSPAAGTIMQITSRH
jgi:hypothetical protein